MFRGEVWTMTLSRKREAEDANSRTVVILSSDALGTLPLRVVVPLTAWRDEYSGALWMVRIPPVLNSGLDLAMAADALQVRSVSSARLTRKLGELPVHLVDKVAEAVAVILNTGTAHRV